jgi:hypothetical protein
MQGTQLLAGLADQVAFANQDLVGLCRFARYADITVAFQSPGVRPGGCSA